MRPLVASLAVVLAGSAVLGQATDGFAALTTESARRLAALTDMPAVPAFPVETMTGERLLLPRHDRKATVVEFIYTNCPTICQVAGAEMARLRDRLAAGPLAGRVRLVSLSFDPARDTREQMAEYGRWHGADGKVWTVARPGPTDLPALLGAYGVTVIPDRTGGFIHNAALQIVSPDGRLTAILDMDDLDGAEKALERALR
ncbi:MAG: SCO family protein [Hyphomicrobiales bacterium]|nr:SCO family protein [Hyphomicrobiales bacterium]